MGLDPASRPACLPEELGDNPLSFVSHDLDVREPNFVPVSKVPLSLCDHLITSYEGPGFRPFSNAGTPDLRMQQSREAVDVVSPSYSRADAIREEARANILATLGNR